CWAVLVVLAAVLVSLSGVTLFAQNPSSPERSAIAIEGTIHGSAGEPIADAIVVLQEKGHSQPLETKTSADGTFVFSAPGAGTYTVTAEKSGLRNGVSEPLIVSAGEKKRVNLVLVSFEVQGRVSAGASSPAVSSPGSMEFEDKPDFTVAGVSDWSDLGLHASGTNVRTSEALAKDTLALKSGGPDEAHLNGPNAEKTPRETRESENELLAAVVQAPKSFRANHQLGAFYVDSQRYREAIPPLEAAFRINPGDPANALDLALAYKATDNSTQARDEISKILTNTNTGDLHRLLGDLDEQLGDSLEAVRQYETAVHLDPSEQNYFGWGTELLLHKATQPAAEVFTKGLSVYPNSARMLAGLGAALYAGGSYEDAARRLCDASDLKPTDPFPYAFLNEMEMATSEPLPCAEQRLARFAQEQPGNALANYYYAMALWKGERVSGNLANTQPAEVLLQKAVTIDPKLGKAFLQLGNLYSAREDFAQAIDAYHKALQANSDLGEAHYQLSLAYRRIGEDARAHQEFQAYQEAEKTEAAAAESQQRQFRRFLIILQEQSTAPAPR
ncbi:MAG: tetratricopeptide repeat protein, partial [Candidatus Acidiferrales bacterium]